MSFSMRWEAFKARHQQFLPTAGPTDPNQVPQADEPPHSLRQHFAVSTRTVDSAGATFEVYSVAPMKFGDPSGADADAYSELDPAQSAKRAILYVLPGGFAVPIRKRNWDFVAILANAGYRVDIPLYGLTPTYSVEHGLPLIIQCFQQLVDDHGADNVNVIGDSAGGGLALAALTSAEWPSDAREQVALGVVPKNHPRTLILNAPWVDIDLSNPAIENYKERDPLLDVDKLRRQGALWSRAAGQSLPAEHPAASPLFLGEDRLQAALGGVNVHVFCGDADVSLPDARETARKCGGSLHEVAGAIHMFHLGHTPEGKAARREFLEILHD